MDTSTVGILGPSSIVVDFVESVTTSAENVVGNNCHAVEDGIAKGNEDSLNKTSLLRKKYLFFRSYIYTL